MLARHLLLAACLLTTTTVTAGCRDACVSTCQLRAKELGCAHPEKCREGCDKLRTSPVCQAEFKTFKACFLKVPPDHWVCDDNGIPAMREDACLPEKWKVSDCLDQHPPPPTPGR
jgi:hypothetical protein